MHLLLLSGRTPRALALRARAFLEWCESRPEVPLRDVCFTAAVRHAHYRYRLGVVCTSLADCATRLADTLAHLPEPSPTRPALVFAFAGGSHGDRRRYRQLVHRFPEMRRSVTTPQYSAGAALNRTDLASDTAIAAWFCRLGLVPDAVMVDAAEALSAREIAEMIHGPVPATVRHSVPVAVDERALNQICGTERVVLRFGDSPASGASSARGSADLTVLSPSDVLNVLGELYTLGFDPMWPKVLPRGSVVSLPVHTWDRAAATSGRATVPDLPDRDAGAVAFDRWVRQQLCEILARPADSFPGTGSLLSLGLDSLAALDLEERLHGAFGIEMRLLRELDDFTLDALVERLIGSCARLDLAPLAVASAD